MEESCTEKCSFFFVGQRLTIASQGITVDVLPNDVPA